MWFNPIAMSLSLSFSLQEQLTPSCSFMQKPFYCERCFIILKCLVPITALFLPHFRNNIVFFGPHCAVKHIVVRLGHLDFADMQQTTSLQQLISEMTGCTNEWFYFFFFCTKQTGKDAKCLIELCGPKGTILLRSISANSSKHEIF